MRIYTTLPCITKDPGTNVVTYYEHDVDLATVQGYYPAFGDDSDTTNVDFDSGDGLSVNMPIAEFRELMKINRFVWFNG